MHFVCEHLSLVCEHLPLTRDFCVNVNPRALNPFPSAEICTFEFCHHVIFVSKPLQSAFFLDVERCCLDGT